MSNEYSFYFCVCRNHVSLITLIVYCKIHLFCADFDLKVEEVILVYHYDLLLLNSGGPDSQCPAVCTEVICV